MVQISRAALRLAGTCYAAVTSLALAATTNGNDIATAVPVPVETSSNATASTTEEAGVRMHARDCEITFSYWEHDQLPTFDINFVHTRGSDHTTETFHDAAMPIQTSNTETISGFLNLVQIYPRQEMVCISAIKLECGWLAIAPTSNNQALSVVITADAIQESWIRKTGGQRKPVNWANGPCLYFRNAGWDTGAFRALDIYRGVFDCGGDYMCIAGRIETFSH